MCQHFRPRLVRFILIVLGAVIILSSYIGRAQQVTPTSNNAVANNQTTGLAVDAQPVTRTTLVDYGYLSSKEWWLTLAALAFFLIVIFLKFLLIRNNSSSSRRDFVHFELTVIIAATVLTVLAGFDEKQMAPALGLFGTVAGYLLANSRTGDAPPSQEGEKK